MSLQVWLPLNGDLHNQGLDNIIFNNLNATIDNNGKIGKCYLFNGSTSRIYNNNFTIGNEWSAGCWFYATNSSSAWIALILLNNSSGDSDTQIGLYCNPSTGKLSSIANGVSHVNTFSCANKWVHFTTTFKNRVLKTYVNGQLIGQKTITNTPLSKHHLTIGARCTSTTGAGDKIGGQFEGKINDVRIYNHCLSAKEVEEISKGLVLHYKLDNIIDNNIYDSSGYKNNGIIAGDTFELSSDSAKYSHSISLPNNNWIRVINRPTIVCSHDAITVNIWAKIATSWSYNKGALISCQEDGGWAIAKNSSNILYFQIYADGAYRAAKAPNNTYVTSILNGWHMFTGTADSSTVNLYLDGELIGTGENAATTGFSYANNYIFIGAEAVSNNVTPYSTINGLFGDARIYATALTPHQIRELYQTSTTIDKNGNIYAKEYIENNANININKNGQLQSNKIVDSNDITIANFKKPDKSINSNTIYEY